MSVRAPETGLQVADACFDAGIFRPPLAAELARYRDAAAEEISARIAGQLRGRAENT